MKWNNINIQPPDEWVKVRDNYGNEGYSRPIYSSFKYNEVKSRGRPRVETISCEPYWSGKWVVVEPNSSVKYDDIVEWRVLTTAEKKLTEPKNTLK